MKQKMTLPEFLQLNPLYLEHLQDGFNNYPNQILETDENNMSKILSKLADINGYENTYADFYYGNLNEESKEIVKKWLDEESNKKIKALHLKKGELFIPMTEEILLALAYLTEKEILFSTFYFLKLDCSIWGNYGLKYPIFFRNKEAQDRFNLFLKKIGGKI